MGMVMYGDEFETKENKFKPRIKLNHNIYIDVMWLTEKDLQREIKKKGDQFCSRKNMKIWIGSEKMKKMLVATKMKTSSSGNIGEQEHIQQFLHNTCK